MYCCNVAQILFCTPKTFNLLSVRSFIGSFLPVNFFSQFGFFQASIDAYISTHIYAFLYVRIILFASSSKIVAYQSVHSFIVTYNLKNHLKRVEVVKTRRNFILRLSHCIHECVLLSHTSINSLKIYKRRIQNSNFLTFNQL